MTGSLPVSISSVDNYVHVISSKEAVGSAIYTFSICLGKVSVSTDNSVVIPKPTPLLADTLYFT
jgi:hypothetical protein